MSRKVNIVISLMSIILMVSFLIFKTKAEEITYVYLDLGCGNITINASTYSGCVYQNIDGTTTSLTVSGSHAASNYYYIYQSNANNQSITGYVDEKFVLPVYSSLEKIIEEKITNNTDVDAVINTWAEEAANIGRSATANRVSISGASTYDVTIDNLWSSYHQKSTSRQTGGISVVPSTGMKTTIRIKGDNRFGNIFYGNSSASTSLTFTSFEGDNETSGTLTVANLKANADTNYWDTAIGGSDSALETVLNLNFKGGTIYAGTTIKDNCTAIGGGGNGTGGVNISGGIITAVSNSTGTAIGGGIGMSSQGGNADIKISGGVVYAYNTGQAYAANVFVPGVAIGGGSSRYSNGNASTTIAITGGTVYAESRGGVAIGGGSSATKNGGIGTVTISADSNVTAKSIKGTYTYSGKEYEIAAGSGIGGGTGGTGGNGGNAVVTISGGTVNSGTIGGGETNNTSGTVGSATIKIEGGTVNGRILMHTGTFEMTGGTLTGGTSTTGGCVQMYGGTATISGGEITKCNATNNGGAIYLEGGTFNSNGGKINANVATNNGGAVYLGGGTFSSNGGHIYDNQATNGGGVFIADGIVNIISGQIESNIASTGDGGGVYIDGNGTFIITGGEIRGNKAEQGNGGGVYLNSGIYTMESGTISNNTSLNGGGAYVNSARFTLTGGLFDQNIATNNGGGFFVGDNSTVSLSNGTISNNKAVNGGGFYQTQAASETITNISGNCIITENEAINGNGAGVYIDGGSTFRMIGGKVTYNQATATSRSNITAKESVSGVGGGVYILNGIFTMYDELDNPGNAAIFGNIADVAADDLFASGNNTSFDAISVINMEKADAYKTADSWFEDFPLNESHITLNNEIRNDGDTSNDTIVSLGRYKEMIDSEDKHVATTVLYRNCTDYIAITMGNSVGKIKLSVLGDNVIKAHSFIYKIESCSTEECNDETPEVVINTLVQKEQDVTIIDMSTGIYKITIIPSWSWRYNENVKFKVVENSIEKDIITSKSVRFNVYSEQYTNINTYYEFIDKHWLSQSSIVEG